MSHRCGIDHHAGEYDERQRADLELVRGFNRRLVAATDAGRDVSGVEPLLDPDPLRWMWVDEGGGRLAGFLARADAALAAAPTLPGHRREPSDQLTSSGTAVRPSVAVGADGRVLTAWLEWTAGAGEAVLAGVAGPGAAPEPVLLSPHRADHFRPTACFDRQGVGWVAYGRAEAGAVAVYCRRLVGAEWEPEQLVSTTAHPSFNQELTAHADGSVEVCWQGPHGSGFGAYSRRFRDGAWGPTRLLSAGAQGNVWDPAVAARPDGGTAYAWAAYRGGSYAVVVVTADPSGELAEPREVTAGTDYALHPSLAVTPDGAVWCAFDVLSVHGHGGSGPTRLRPAAEVGAEAGYRGMLAGGAAIPPELRPDIEAGIRVVRVDPDGLWEPAGELAPGLDVVPAGLPRLAAGPAGGLVVAYRVHRRLPLMTYYWEVVAQALGPDGWGPPVTFADSDASLEEPAVATAPAGVLVAWQTDGRRGCGLDWTEGFGGRECPYLLEHQGEVVWHGMHGTGRLRSAQVVAEPARPPGQPVPIAASSRRIEARPWLAEPGGRYQTEVAGTAYSLYWGDLHRHSLVSRCTAGDEPSLEDFYRYSWDVCEYDFWAVTDHSENSSDYQWWSIQKIADLFRVDGRFVPLYGFEWTGDTGHQNVIYGDVRRGAPIYSAYADLSRTPDQLWAHLRGHGLPVLTIPHHPGSAMVAMDWSYHDPELLRLVEVFQACRGNYEYDGCFRQYSDGTLPGTFMADGLHQGHRFGLIASSDHGHGAAYVGAYATSLDRAAVFEALHARRVFAATTRGIVVDFRAAGAFMGTAVAHDGPVEIEAYVRGYGELARIDVLRCGEVVHSVQAEPELPAGWIAVPLRVEWHGSVEPADWSGTLAVGDGEVLGTPYWSPEICTVNRNSVAWAAATTCFGEEYGTQRGGVELTVIGPPEAAVTLRTAQGEGQATLGRLQAGWLPVAVRGGGRLGVGPGTGGLVGLGRAEHRLSWLEQAGGPAWYYLRAIQTDGELAWSSPVWVDRAG